MSTSNKQIMHWAESGVESTVDACRRRLAAATAYRRRSSRRETRTNSWGDVGAHGSTSSRCQEAAHSEASALTRSQTCSCDWNGARVRGHDGEALLGEALRDVFTHGLARSSAFAVLACPLLFQLRPEFDELRVPVRHVPRVLGSQAGQGAVVDDEVVFLGCRRNANEQRQLLWNVLPKHLERVRFDSAALLGEAKPALRP
ncbi:hypothetical protein ON010_g7162 [Phytophthora cinnamomi]|nr:hypothetical protein ON010_g7162 [Phytophthora cinnamomi]